MCLASAAAATQAPTFGLKGLHQIRKTYFEIALVGLNVLMKVFLSKAYLCLFCNL